MAPREGQQPDSLVYTSCDNQQTRSGTGGGLSSSEQQQQRANERDNAMLKKWLKYFERCGRGCTMMRTHRAHEYVLRGLPASLRGELWLVFSGSLFDVCSSS